MVPGTKNFFFSMSGKSDRGAFSQITGMRSGYFAKMRPDSATLFSKGTVSRSDEVTAIPSGDATHNGRGWTVAFTHALRRGERA
eukprot:CAMPEP_0117551314 /NCGR_PEP_ID=MMETSP0784-20121206/49130_1 /TAXON_ID=39447 /ORGANISM="" /LENGTH=83 /DNA_ID=CAMNT_0005348355 /DNA_START=317 /DNA_END=564 /DNA_ORIENTATION=-